MIKVELVTPEKIIAEDMAEIVSIPGSEGDLGVLVGHTPLLSALRTGAFRYKNEKEESFFISGGFVEVLPNKVTVLAEVAEKKNNIDIDRAKKSKKRAEERLDAYKTDNNSDINFTRAQASLIKAINRLKITEQS